MQIHTAGNVRAPSEVRARQEARVDLRDRENVAKTVDRSFVWTFIAVLVVMALVPLYWVFEASLVDGARGIRTAFGGDRWPRVLATTFALAVGSVSIAVVLGTLLAWFAHRLPPGRRWLGALPIMQLVVPAMSIATGWVFLLSPRIGYLNVLLRKVLFFYDGAEGPFDIYTLPWIVIITALGCTAFVYMFVRSGLAQLNGELIDAAEAAGASSVRVMVFVVLPLLLPSILYGTATTFLLAVGQVTTPLLLGRQEGINVLSTEMYHYMEISPSDQGAAAAYGMPIILVALPLLALQRYLLRDQSKYVTVSGKGGRPLSSTGLFGQAALALFGLFGVVLPVLAIAYVSLSRFWTAKMSLDGLTLDIYRRVFSDPVLYPSIVNTMVFTLVAVAITLPLSYVCARLIYRRRLRPTSSALVEMIVALPVGIPGVIFGMGFYIAYTGLPFSLLGINGTMWSMVFVYVTLMIPFATRILLAAMVGIGEDLSDAGSVSGGGRLRCLTFLDFPMLRPAVGVSAALMVALIAQEFSASLMVRTANTQVLSTALYDRWTFSSYPDVAALAGIMCVITGLGVGLAFVLGGRSANERLVG